MVKTEFHVWVGFSDNKPHVAYTDPGNAPQYSVYRTRREARREYEDVRPATLVMHVPSMTNKRKRK